MNQLSTFGWTDEFSQKWDSLNLVDVQPARVIADFGTSLKIALPQIITAELSGKLAHHSNREFVPKVGDWVAVRVADSGHAIIEAVVPRRSEIARKVTGHRTVKQVIAANVDIAFVLLSLDNDFSVERLKRFLYQLSINHIEPVIVLNKADKTDDIESYVDQLRTLKLPIIISSAISESGVPEMLDYIEVGHTAILLGSSGVGKSTITNRLLGRSVQATQVIRGSDETGRHTTVHRELFILPGGGLLIDTPGIRELQLWGTQTDLDDNFDDVATLIGQCKYSTCQHGNEEGCAVRVALINGTLLSSHLASYKKMKSELANLKERNFVILKRKNKKTKKKLSRQSRDRDIAEDIHSQT